MSATATPRGGPAGRPRRWRAVGWVLAATGVLAVLLAVVFVVPRLLYPPLPTSRFAGVAPDKRIELETDRLKLQNDARATLLQALAGGVLLLGAYFTSARACSHATRRCRSSSCPGAGSSTPPSRRCTPTGSPLSHSISIER